MAGTPVTLSKGSCWRSRSPIPLPGSSNFSAAVP